MGNKGFVFNDIPWAAIILGFIFFWPAGLVMLVLKLFGDSNNAGRKNGAQQGAQPHRHVTPPPAFAGGSVPPPPPQKAQAAQNVRPVSPAGPASAAQRAAGAAVPPPRSVRQAQANASNGGTYEYKYPHEYKAAPAQSAQPVRGVSAPAPAGPVRSGAYKKPDRAEPRLKTGGATFVAVLGALMAFAGFLVITIMLLQFFFYRNILFANTLMTCAIMLLVLCLPGLVLIITGSRVRAAKIRARRYLKIIGANKVVSIDHLASLIPTSYQTASKDLVALIDKGYLKEAYVDWDERELVFGNPFDRKKPKTVVKSAGELSPAEQIRKINDEIADKEISEKLDRMEDITRRIFEYVDAKPENIGRIKNFTGYYLPMTMKILNAYTRFEKQKVEGKNIGTAMKDIEEILDTLVKGFENQLDSLFMDEALDVSSDIAVLEGMLAREGLTGSGFDLKL